MDKTTVLGIVVLDRIKEAGRTQKVLTENADVIRTRLGFHEVSEDVCSRHGLILIVLKGDDEGKSKLEKKLAGIGGIQVKKMSFDG